MILNKILTSIRMLFRSGPSIELAAAVDASNIKALLHHLCNDDDELTLWVSRWLAYPLRHHNAKMTTALFVGGPQGAGRSLFFGGVMASLYGAEGKIILSDELEAPFSSWALDKRYVLVDEITNAEKAAGAMKTMVTSKKIVINRKGKPARIIVNTMNFVFMSGYADAMGFGGDTRRLCFIEPNHRLNKDFAYQVSVEIENGGIVDFYRYLMTDLDMGDFQPYTPPPMQQVALGGLV